MELIKNEDRNHIQQISIKRCLIIISLFSVSLFCYLSVDALFILLLSFLSLSLFFLVSFVFFHNLLFLSSFYLSISLILSLPLIVSIFPLSSPTIFVSKLRLILERVITVDTTSRIYYKTVSSERFSKFQSTLARTDWSVDAEGFHTGNV